MSLKIDSLTINNFRSFSNETPLPLSDLTALVGYNNAGKSNILSAVEWLISSSSLKEDDFNDCNACVEVIAEIDGVNEGVLDRLGQAHRRRIERYLNNERVIVKRVQNEPNMKASDNKLWLYDEGQENWDYNPTGIDAAIKKLFPDVIRIKAMDDAAADASKAKSTSTIGKLLKQVSTTMEEAQKENIDRGLKEVRESLSADGENRVEALEEVDGLMNQSISSFFPKVNVKLDVPVPDFSELLESGTIKIYEEGHVDGRPIQYYGHGAQRSIQMALIKLLADIKGRIAEGDEPSTTLILIDEPELYLHPFAINILASSFKKLSESGYQIIYSTHSPQMINRDDFGATLLVRKSVDRGTYIREPINVAVREVVRNPEHCQELIYSLSHAAQIFFSEKIVLAEGKTEGRVIPEVYSILYEKSLGHDNIGITYLGGKDVYPKLHSIFDHIDLPAKFVTDLDFVFCSALSGFVIDTNDDDYKALVDILCCNKEDWGVKLNDDCHPIKRGALLNAEQAFSRLAQEDDAIKHIESLHNKFIHHNIWIWKKGSFEDHFGNESKNELGLLRYIRRINDEGAENVFPDPDGVREFFEWVRAS
ncbi:ATP-dependent nuclease [Halomonas elongata]|uniref:ATP-dependent nuclease n=1 Tax=Halomonas elongata TaxID=2746 RepID=UPI0038D43957